ncbi:MAG: GDSL-type esterase/lipase family protein [Chthonomonadales bacterium]
MICLMTALPSMTPSAPRIEVVAPWRIRVTAGIVSGPGIRVQVHRSVTLDVAPPPVLEVRDERYDGLPLFDASWPSWAKGVPLAHLRTEETTAAGMLIPGSFVLKRGPGNAERYVAGKDYTLDVEWARLARLPGGVPEEASVWADYSYSKSRLDAVVVSEQGEVVLRQGEADLATPHPPAVGAGEVRLANIWVPGRLARLTPENVYEVLEPRYVEPRRPEPPAVHLLPKTWAKLHSGAPLHILAWGDSVTAGGAASSVDRRYQNRFVAMLQRKFPAARITLTTAGWGGRSSESFLREPPGAPFNFDHAVIEPKPDLVVMEFVNDAYLTPDQVEERYSYFLRRFQEIGAEWIILTPHFVRPDWMGASSVRVEADPRPYVAGLRAFAARHHVALADASLRWGHLLKEGIPYITLLANCINHPDDRGHEIFARALMELFGGAP